MLKYLIETLIIWFSVLKIAYLINFIRTNHFVSNYYIIQFNWNIERIIVVVGIKMQRI